jgi:hypothetical protein
LTARAARGLTRAFAALVALAIGVGSWGLTPFSAAAETVSLSRDQAIAVARRAWLGGDVALAYAIASKIAAADPTDVEALLLVSACNEVLGRSEQSFQIGRQAWTAARAAGRPEGLRFEIAVQTARAAFAAERPRQAAFWLGRAVDLAPDPARQAATQRDLAQVKSQIPLTFSGSLQISPTDNLNNGATVGLLIVEDTVIGLLSGWSVAREGVVTTAQVGAEYNLGVTRSGLARSSLGIDLSGTFHQLSAAEALANPSLDGSQLDLVRGAIRLSQDRLLQFGPSGELPIQVSLEASQSWYAGEPYAPSLRAEATVQVSGPDAPMQFALQTVIERQWQDAPSHEVDGLRLYLNGQRGLDLPWGEGKLRLAIGASFLRSDFANTTYDMLDASVSLDPGVKIGKVQSQFSLGASWRHHDEFSLFFANATKGRTDRGLSQRVSFSLDDVTVLGLTPTLTVQRQMSWSNISKYETEATSVYFGFAREF